MRYENVPGWLVFAGMTVVASIVLGGVMALLILGRPVPAELWTLVGAVGVAYFGSGPFSQVLASHQARRINDFQHASALLDTVNHAIASSTQIATGSVGTSSTNGGAGTTSRSEPAISPS